MIFNMQLSMFRMNCTKTFLIESVYKSELDILTQLAGKVGVPNIISYDDSSRSIIMPYLGQGIVSGVEIPTDWKQQINNIRDLLEEMNIYHNDLKLKHFLVLRDVITLIDFGKASLYIQFPYNNFWDYIIYQIANHVVENPIIDTP